MESSSQERNLHSYRGRRDLRQDIRRPAADHAYDSSEARRENQNREEKRSRYFLLSRADNAPRELFSSTRATRFSPLTVVGSESPGYGQTVSMVEDP